MLNGLRHFVWMGFVSLTVTFASCGGEEPAFYDEYQAVPESGWKIGEKLTYEVEMTDTVFPYHFYLNVRNAGDYSYQNIFFYFHTEFPNGKSSLDTVELVLANNAGKWVGESSGSLYHSKHQFKFARVFPLAGTYKFSIEHAMREENLQGITDVGLRLEEANNNQQK